MKEVGTKYGVLDLCYYKDPGKGTPQSQVEGEGATTKCADF